MTASGTIDTTVVRTGEIIDTAFRRCRVKSSLITQEMIGVAKLQLYTELSSLPNKGRLLWTIRESLIGLKLSTAQYTLPAGVVDVDKCFYRTVAAQSGGTPASSNGGTAANAFDGNVATACTQTAPNGNISYVFATSTTVTIVGVMSNGTNTWQLAFQSSTDGVSWTTIYTPSSQSYTDGVFTWFSITAPLAGTYFRCVVSGGGTLNVRELVFGNNPNDIELARMNQDDFTALPNRTFQGDPNQFWLERPYNSTLMNVWPTPNNVFNLIVAWNRRYVMDVGQLYDTMEIPRRWIDAIQWALAWRVYHELPDEVVKFDGQYLAYLGTMMKSSQGEAFDEERDRSPVKFGPRIGCYTS
jgi:hypothetical protein